MSYKPMKFPSMKGDWLLTQEVYDELAEDFPETDIDASLLDARAWARANPKKADVRRFITNWLIKNRKDGVHLRINRATANTPPRFTGTDDFIKCCERIWRKNPTWAKGKCEDEAQRMMHDRRGEPSNVTSLSDIVAAFKEAK